MFLDTINILKNDKVSKPNMIDSDADFSRGSANFSILKILYQVKPEKNLKKEKSFLSAAGDMMKSMIKQKELTQMKMTTRMILMDLLDLLMIKKQN